MAFNGSGVFLRFYNWTNDAAADIKIRADRMDSEFNGISTGLTNCITKDGQTTVTANLPMAGFKHTGVGNASASNEYAAYGQLTTALAAITLDSLSDVVITSLASGDIIRYNGTNWVNTQVTNFGISLINDADAATARTTLGLGTAATTASSAYATAAQGALADTAVQPDDITAANGMAIVLLDTQIASSSASLNFTTNSTYDHYIFEIIDLVPATNNVVLQATFNNDTGASKYKWMNDRNFGAATTVAPINDTADPSIVFCNTIGNGANDFAQGRFEIFNANSSKYKATSGDMCSYYTTANEVHSWKSNAVWLDATAITSVQFKMSSGNIASGEIRMYAIRKS